MFRKHKLLSLGFILLSLNLFSQQHTFYGVVKDSITGIELENVDVVVKNHSTGTLSEITGEFILYLDPGKYEIVFSLSGYFKTTFNLELSENTKSEIFLIRQPKTERNPNSLFRKLLSETKTEVSNRLTAQKGPS